MIPFFAIVDDSSFLTVASGGGAVWLAKIWWEIRQQRLDKESETIRRNNLIEQTRLSQEQTKLLKKQTKLFKKERKSSRKHHKKTHQLLREVLARQIPKSTQPPPT